MNSDGTEQTKLTNSNELERSPAWSPDGTQIVFSVAKDFNDHSHEIYIINTDGSGRQNITNHAAHDGQPSWTNMALIFTNFIFLPSIQNN